MPDYVMSPRNTSSAAAAVAPEDYNYCTDDGVAATKLAPHQIPAAVARHLRVHDHFGVKMEVVQPPPPPPLPSTESSVFINENSGDTPLLRQQQATPPAVMPHPQQLPLASSHDGYGYSGGIGNGLMGEASVATAGSGFYHSQYSPPHGDAASQHNLTYLADRTMVELSNLPPYEGPEDAGGNYVICEMYSSGATGSNGHPMSSSDDILSQSMSIALGDQYSTQNSPSASADYANNGFVSNEWESGTSNGILHTRDDASFECGNSG